MGTEHLLIAIIEDGKTTPCGFCRFWAPTQTALWQALQQLNNTGFHKRGRPVPAAGKRAAKPARLWSSSAAT
ncbi:MAG: hypothetical protein ACLRSY_03505 [Acutalibacter sp.]